MKTGCGAQGAGRKINGKLLTVNRELLTVLIDTTIFAMIQKVDKSPQVTEATLW